MAMEAYLTLCYSIKWDHVGLLQIALQKICIIFQAPSANKPKYARKMLCQVHISDLNAADLVFCKTYIANALINLRKLPHTFYEMDLILEHQNGKFKQFRADRGSLLQERDEMFKLHLLSVDALLKIRQAMNKVIIGRKQLGRHHIKNSSFDILSLADQLYRSKSTVPEGPKPGKVYFSKNPASDLILDNMKVLTAQVKAFNILLESNEPVEVGDGDANKDTTGEKSHLIKVSNDGINKAVSDLFLSAQELACMISDLTDMFL